jgi:hypothetical protein
MRSVVKKLYIPIIKITIGKVSSDVLMDGASYMNIFSIRVRRDILNNSL